MTRATARWLASSAVLLFAVTVLTFLLTALAPGDAAKAILSGQTTSYTPQQYQQVRHDLGIDQPLPVQYWHWLYRLLHGSLGTDLFSGQPITQALNGRLGASLSIIVGTVVLSAVLGIGIGVFSAVRGGIAGKLVNSLSLFRTSGSPWCWSNCSPFGRPCFPPPGTPPARAHSHGCAAWCCRSWRWRSAARHSSPARPGTRWPTC